MGLAAPRFGGRHRPRSPAFVQIALSVGLAIILAAVTLTTRQPPPPAIAEFAPQAAEQIKDPPKEQASEFGSGSGEGDCPPGAQCDAGHGAGAAASSATTITTTAATQSAPTQSGTRPSRTRCVGDPPRQIEDPQSPPCVPFWDDSNGNGGATAPGVTKDTITIATPNAVDGLYEGLTTFFNNRFQLYGRRIEIKETSQKGTAGADQAKQLGAFAALTSYADPPFYRRLAEHKIIGTYRTPEFTDTDLAAAAPYLWGHPPSYSQILNDLGNWACRRLVGQKATHAGRTDTTELSASDRSFAIVLNIGTDDLALKPDQLKAVVEQCGGQVRFTSTTNRDFDVARVRNDIAAMKSAGVTTVFCLCYSPNMGYLHSAADAQAYQPEWIITTYPQFVQGDAWGSLSQADRMFGISFEPMSRTPMDHPQIWALREGDPNSPYATGAATVESNDVHYRGFLLLLSGIQMAGPNLTPETFRQGLQRTKFPNPDHPIMAGKVGFAGDFSMANDAAEFWFTRSDPGPYNQSFTFCWVDGGRRYAKGMFPKGGDPFFHGPCDSGKQSVS